MKNSLTGDSMKYTETFERMKDRKSGSPLMKKVSRAAVVWNTWEAPDPHHPTTTVCKLFESLI